MDESSKPIFIFKELGNYRNVKRTLPSVRVMSIWGWRYTQTQRSKSEEQHVRARTPFDIGVRMVRLGCRVAFWVTYNDRGNDEEKNDCNTTRKKKPQRCGNGTGGVDGTKR